MGAAAAMNSVPMLSLEADAARRDRQQGSGQHGCGAGWLGSGAGLAASSMPTPGQAMAKDAVASVIQPLDALLKASTLLLGRQPLPLRFSNQHVLVGSIVGLLL
jgi:hypothetical protein